MRGQRNARDAVALPVGLPGSVRLQDFGAEITGKTGGYEALVVSLAVLAQSGLLRESLVAKVAAERLIAQVDIGVIGQLLLGSEQLVTMWAGELPLAVVHRNVPFQLGHGDGIFGTLWTRHVAGACQRTLVLCRQMSFETVETFC